MTESDAAAMSRGDITSKARKAHDFAERAARATAELVTRMEDARPESTAEAARAHQETVGYMTDALSLLNELATRRSADHAEEERR